MRFGAFVPQGWRLDLVGVPKEEHWPTIVDVAKTIEASGFESLWVFDHFHTIPVPTQEVTYEAWTLMSALAATTETVRLGQMCTSNSYRPPAYLAKVAACVDVISRGRLEVGIGGGWYEHEYLGYGYEFPKASVRLSELEEAVQIMIRMWTEDEVVFEGEHYQLAGAICRPKPIQKPHIPVWIAGGGEKMTLGIAARFAQYTNFGWSFEEFKHKIEILAGHCRKIGRDFDSIVRSSNFSLVCASNEKEVNEKLDWIQDRYRHFVSEEKAAEIRADFASNSGTPEQIVEMLRAWKREGLDYAIVVMLESANDRTGLELFGREVIPAMKD